MDSMAERLPKREIETIMPEKIQQFIYTSSPWNLQNGGYGIFTKSPGLELGQAVKYSGLFTYNVPDGISDDVSGCPVSYIAMHVPERSVCLVGTSRYLGKRWYEHRGGDYISHVLMIPDEFFPFRFSELFHSGYFWQEVPEELRNRALEYMKRPFEEEPPPLEEISQEAFLAILERGREKANERLRQIACEVQGVEFASLFDSMLENTAERSVRIDLATSSLRNIMEFIPDFLPPGVRQNANFETFACNNAPKKASFSGFLGGNQHASNQSTSVESVVDLPGIYQLTKNWGGREDAAKAACDFKDTAKFLYMTQNGMPMALMPLDLLTYKDKDSEYLRTLIIEGVEARKDGWEARALLAKIVYGLEISEETLQDAEAFLAEKDSIEELIALMDFLPDRLVRQTELLRHLPSVGAKRDALLEQCDKLIGKRTELAKAILFEQFCVVEKGLGDMAASAMALHYLGSGNVPSPLSTEMQTALRSHEDVSNVKATLICFDLQEKLSHGQITGVEISHVLEEIGGLLDNTKEAVCIWLPSLLSNFTLTEKDFEILYGLCAKTEAGSHEMINAFLPQNGGVLFDFLVMLDFLSRHFDGIDNADKNQEYLDSLEQLRKCSYSDWQIAQDVFGENFTKMLGGALRLLMDETASSTEDTEEEDDKTSFWKHVKSLFR